MKDFDQLIADLKRERDELRVQLDLASKDLRDEMQEEWDEFQEKYRSFSAKAEIREAREEIEEELSELADDIKRGFARLKDAFKD